MKDENIKTKEEALATFDSFAERTNWFDNETARANLRIYIEEVWDSSKVEVHDKCEHLWETQYAMEIPVSERERQSTYSPVKQLKTWLVCQKCQELKHIIRPL